MKSFVSFLTSDSNQTKDLKEKIKRFVRGKVHFVELEEHKIFSQESNSQHICVVVGGDGSLHHAINRIMNLSLADLISVCYIPNGTGNDFSRMVGLHDLEVCDILSLISNEQKKKIALGKIANIFFVNMASCGVFAEITPSVDEKLKKLLGCWSYYLKGISMLGELNSWRCHFEVDGEKKIINETILGFFIGNSKYAGGGIQVASDADPSQKELDLLIIKKMNVTQLLSLGLELQKEKPELSNYPVLYKKFKKLNFEADRSFKSSIDGEQKELSKGSIEVLPDMLNIYFEGGVAPTQF